MYKYKIIFPLLMTVFMLTAVYGQENSGKDHPKIISGTVTNMDFVGSGISIQTEDGHQMSFFVPGNAIITRDAHDIGLMDVKVSHPVTIQYEILSPGKDVVDSIVDHKPSSHQ